MQSFFFIAKRYLYITKKRKIIHFIGLVASISMSISTASIIISTGVYNGLEMIVHEMLKSIDSDIKIGLKRGNRFKQSEVNVQSLIKIPGVCRVSEILEDHVIAMSGKNTSLAYLRGSKEHYNTHDNLSICTPNMNIGSNKNNKTLASIGSGIAKALCINHIGQSIKLLYPNRNKSGKFNLIRKPYYLRSISVKDIFSIDKEQDDKYIIAPLSFAQKLMNKKNTINFVNVDIVLKKNTTSIKKKIEKYLDNNRFYVKSIDEQQKTLIQAVKLEKICTKAVFSAIMLIAAVNIFFVLSMLVLIKKEDLHTLYILGASKKDILKIFMIVGFIISLRGSFVGGFIASVLGIIQQKYGVISLGAFLGNSTAYPIQIHLKDFVYTCISVVLTTLIASWAPLYIYLRNWTYVKKAN